VPIGGEGEGPGSRRTHLINESNRKKKFFGDGDEGRRGREEEEEEDADLRFILPMTQGSGTAVEELMFTSANPQFFV
jgi:hypothetical protein